MQASELFCDDLLQDVPIEAQVRDQPLQLVVLFSQLTELPQLVQTQARVLLLPEVEALLTDAMLAADLHYGRTCFSFPKHPQNLFLRVSSLTHPSLLLVSSRQPPRPRTLNFKTEEFLGFGSPQDDLVLLGGRHCAIEILDDLRRLISVPVDELLRVS